jgi:hypothetical protein
MWSSIVEHAKLAVCDGLSRKAPELKKAPQRKLRFDDSSLTDSSEQKRYSILDYAKLAVCDDRARKTLESNKVPPRKLPSDDSPTRSLERIQHKRVDSSQIFKECAEEIVRSVSVNSFAESVKSLGVTSWWEQDQKIVRQDKPKKRMRETILVSNELVAFLSGTAANRDDEYGQKQTVLKTVEDACNVELQLRPNLGGHKMQGLAITGTGRERDSAKSMIVRLGSSCRTDTLSSVMDAWNDWSSPSDMHAFMSDRSGHQFEAWSIEPVPTESDMVPEGDHLSMRGDLKSTRSKWAEKGCRKEMDALNGRCTCNCSLCRCKHADQNVDVTQKSRTVPQDPAFDDEMSPARVVRELSRHSNSTFDKRLQSFANRYVV